MDPATDALTQPGSGAFEIAVFALLWLPITGFAFWLTGWTIRSWRLSPSDLRLLEERHVPGGSAGREARDRFRAARRSLGAVVVVVYGVLIFAWSVLIDRVAQGWVGFRSGVPYSREAAMAVAVSLCVAAIGALLLAAGYWLAWPRMFLPPALRRDPGLFQLTRRARAGRCEQPSTTARWKRR